MYDRPISSEDTPRTVILAIALWAAVVAAAARAGAFAMLSFAELAALVAFAVAFATATSYLDRQVRGLVDGLALRVLALFALVGAAVFAAGAVFAQGALAVFAAPLAGVSLVALVARAFSLRTWSARRRAASGGMPSAVA